MKPNRALMPVLAILAGLVAILFVGCATRVDWDMRVGHYTYDEAVGEFGPPDKMARLTDGKLVAEWITHYNSGGTVFVGGGGYPGQVGFVQAVGPTSYENKLRLIFDSHYILCAWKKKYD